MCNCGKPSTIHWQGKGDYCEACFKRDYTDKVVESLTPEEKQRLERIEKNFECKECQY